jgi:steroid delta-isomerase-like uncharacterized protein
MPQSLDSKRAAARFYEQINAAIRTGDVSLLDAVLLPNAVDHNPAPGQGPGREGIKAAFAESREAFPDFRVTVEDMIAEGDKVACRLTVRMTHRGPFLGIPATGKQVSLPVVDLLRFVDGKLAERWGVFDNLALLSQLGVRLPG